MTSFKIDLKEIYCRTHRCLSIIKESISIDCAKLWNNAPEEIKNASTIFSAKREIKKFSRLLEI